MSEKYPYVPAPGHVTKTLNHFRNALPSRIDASTLKKLGLAPKSETFIINLLRFLGLVDTNGISTETARKVFSQHDTSAFQSEFASIVKAAYKELFDLHGDNTWTLERSSLITFFRQANETSARVGTLQASTFLRLASMAGYGELHSPKSRSEKSPNRSNGPKSTKKKKAKAAGNNQHSPPNPNMRGDKEFCLTVRIEINLPSDGDQETYNRIFKSIRDNLLNER